MSCLKVLLEVTFSRRNKILHRIQFLEEKDGYAVIDQIWEENRYKPLNNPGYWRTDFFLPATQRNIARTIFQGRIAIAAYQEGNGDDY